ncbi:MAG: imidazole glycerol phosphate synthase subunit HisH [Armatimonadetes bacterium]|nr:imidazole glycerol phosphate synthase subunit HisH [Armatimonadota bacterium]
MIAIVDYGMGNLGSIQNMIWKIGDESIITSDPLIIKRARKLILPGVGAFDRAVQNLRSRGLMDLLHDQVEKEAKPILGICLGMQLLSKSSEEGELPGFGWIDAHTRRFHVEEDGLRVPHMGWNQVTTTQVHPLTQNLPEDPRFYFVHTYHVACERPEDVLATCHYGIDFHASIGRDHIWGTQFHPEKSHKFGRKLLQNFVEAPCLRPV